MVITELPTIVLDIDSGKALIGEVPIEWPEIPEHQPVYQMKKDYMTTIDLNSGAHQIPQNSFVEKGALKLQRIKTEYDNDGFRKDKKKIKRAVQLFIYVDTRITFVKGLKEFIDEFSPWLWSYAIRTKTPLLETDTGVDYGSSIFTPEFLRSYAQEQKHRPLRKRRV